VTRKKKSPSDTLPPAVGPEPGESGPPPSGFDAAPPPESAPAWDDQPTVNLTGDLAEVLLRDDAASGGAEPAPEHPADPEEPAQGEAAEDAAAGVEEARELTRAHLRGLLEALVFASDKPVKSGELARLASAPVKQVRELLAELKETYARRGVVLDEVAGGWLFRTSVEYAPFVREMSSEKPVRLTRAQVETLAIVAYRQPVTRPEVDDIRGVDSGATLKLLLERDLVRILGKKDEPGRPILYGTTSQFLEFFGLKSLKDLPTLKEFTELSDESRRVAEAELGDVLPDAPPVPGHAALAGDTLTPPPDHDTIAPPASDEDPGDADEGGASD
jgi:segregation and condensation protein B